MISTAQPSPSWLGSGPVRRRRVEGECRDQPARRAYLPASTAWGPPNWSRGADTTESSCTPAMGASSRRSSATWCDPRWAHHPDRDDRRRGDRRRGGVLLGRGPRPGAADPDRRAGRPRAGAAAARRVRAVVGTDHGGTFDPLL